MSGKHLVWHQQIANRSDKRLTIPLPNAYKAPIKGQSWGFHCERDNPCLLGQASGIQPLPLLTTTDGGIGKARVHSINPASEETAHMQNTCLSVCQSVANSLIPPSLQDFFFILLQFFMFCLLSCYPFLLPGDLSLETIPSRKHSSDFLREEYTNTWLQCCRKRGTTGEGLRALPRVEQVSMCEITDIHFASLIPTDTNLDLQPMSPLLLML